MDTPEYNQKRSKLIQILGKINSVANPEGMGRDDLTNDILMAAGAGDIFPFAIGILPGLPPPYVCKYV